MSRYAPFLGRLLLAAWGGLLAHAAVSPAWAARTELDLSGTWQYQKVTNLVYPPPTNWLSTTVPGYLTGWNYERAWFRKTFVPPSTMAGTRLKLRFGGVKFDSRVYVNGALLGGCFNGYDPFELDVTTNALLGQTNELVVGVGDWTALFAQPVDFTQMPSDENPRDFVKDNVLAPIGGRYDLYGVWQPVKLLSVPASSIAEVFAQPSVRNQQLTVRVALRNDGATTQSITLSNRVMNSNAPVLVLPVQQATLPGGAITNLEMTTAWTNAHFWSHLNPYLYTLETTATSGAGVDQVQTRFGFREFWIQGDRCYLNGIPINLLATATWPPSSFIADAQIRKVLQDVKAGYNVALRLHTQPWDERWYEAADEVGLLLVEECAVWCDPAAYRLGDPVFWTNYARHLTAAVKRDWNHPSIILWSLENEILHCGSAAQVTNAEPRLAEMGRVVKGADPTRPITYEADLDPGGEAHILGLHYPYEYPDHAVWPNAAYWMDQFIARRWVAGGQWRWDHTKPLYIGEFLWVPTTSAADFTILFGDDAYADSGYYRTQAKAQTWRMQIEAYRSYGVNGMGPWTLFEDPAVNSGAFDLNIGSNTLYQAQKAAYHPNAVFLEEYCPRAFAGEIVTRNLRVYNDRLVSGNLVLQWRAGAGAWQTRSFTMTPADRRRETVTFAAPAAPGPFALQIRVTEGANTLFSNNVACAALARPALVRPPGVNLGLYDPGGAVAALLARFNLPFVAVTNLGADSYSQFNLLVVGRNALGEAPTLEAGRLTIAAKWQDFMLRGGWVLVLDQTNYPAWMPYELRLGGFDASHAFPNAAHPLMQGLTSEDLRWWTGDHRVVSNVLVMPARGSFRPLASIGSKLGLEYAAAVELPVGPGGLLCAQWLVTTRFDLEPLAGVLFQRMLDYGAPTAPHPALRRAGLVADSNSPAASKLTELGLLFENLSGQPMNFDPASYPVVLLAGDDAFWQRTAGQVASLAGYVNNGGKLVLHRPTSNFLAAAQASLFPQLEALEASLGLVLRRDASNAATRLTNHDLYWIEQAGNWNRAEVLSTNVARRFYRKRFSLTSYATLQVENMPVHSTGNAASGGWWLYQSGYVAQNITNAQPGLCLFNVRARGTPASGVWPQMSLKIDGRAQDAVSVTSTQLAYYTLAADLEAGAHQLAVSFDNDGYAPPEDRNLFLDEIRWGQDPDTTTIPLARPGVVAQVRSGGGVVIVDEVLWEQETRNATKAGRYASTLLTGLGAALRLPMAARLEAEAMTNVNISVYSVSGGLVHAGSNGRLQTTVNFTTTGNYTFDLLASGRPLSNLWPQVAFQLDGVTRTNLSINTSNLGHFTFTLPVAAGVHTVALNFLNDAYAPPEDRNVDYDRLTIAPETPPPGPPLVNLLEPAPGAFFTNRGPVTLSADAGDFDGTIAKVTFLADGGPLAEIASPPYTFTWTNAPLGLHALSAVATDSGGLSATSAVAQITVAALAPVSLIPTGAVWRYFDRTNDLGTGWRSNTFNDSSWKSGPAMLGFGDANGLRPVTVIASNRQWTTYFRRAFYLPDPALVQNLTARLWRDDGAVVYLNGAEVWRDTNMPAAIITNSTPALSSIGSANETNWLTKALSPTHLIAGWNLLAAEVHQVNLTSTDLTFDFELGGTALLTAAPALQVTAAGPALTFTWPADASYFSLYYATRLKPPVTWTPVTNTVVWTNNQWRLPLLAPTHPASFYRLVTH